MKDDFLLLKRVNDRIEEIKEFNSADELAKAANALNAAAPSKTTYQPVFGRNIKANYAVGDMGDDFDLLDEMEA